MKNASRSIGCTTILFLLITALCLLQASSVPAQNVSGKVYVKAAEENLRSAPNGKKVGTVLQGTEGKVLDQQENWVKIQLTGWIWKPSTTTIRPASVEGEYRALHILVKTRQVAEEILKLLKQGKDFRELAKQYSTSPSAANGGDLGFFNKGDFSPKIEAAITSLKVNEYSGIIETEFGFNIFMRLK
jgi:parvulin-like peptidyl-prolyl isomerase